MDWADDVAYSVHDVEDGVHAGPHRARRAGRRGRRRRRAGSWRPRPDYAPTPAAEELAPRAGRLLDLPTLRDLAGYDGTLPAQAALKDLTSELTGRFCRRAERATRAGYGAGPLTRYAADLVVPAASRGRVRAAQGDRRALRHAAGPARVAAAAAAARAARRAGRRVLGRRAPGALDPALRAGLAARRRRRRPAAGGGRPGAPADRHVGRGLARPAGAAGPGRALAPEPSPVAA